MADKEMEGPGSTEDLLYESRFLLNVLIDLLVEKKLITEDELYAKYEKALADAEKEIGTSA